MPNRIESQVQRTDKRGWSRPIEFRAVDMAGDCDMEPSEPNP
jgi:hypothetical protein